MRGGGAGGVWPCAKGRKTEKLPHASSVFLSAAYRYVPAVNIPHYAEFIKQWKTIK